MNTKLLKINPKRPQISKIRYTAALIKEGKIVAFPTETVYGLGANALDASAIKRIFMAKGRPSDNPLIIHIYDKNDVQKLAKEIPIITKKIIDKFWPGPLTIVLKKSKIIPKITTGGLETIAIRMPKNKIAQLLIREAKTPIAAPSANFFGRPSPTMAKHVQEDLSDRIDLIIDGGQTRIGIESTVIDLTRKVPMLLRPGGITLEQLQGIIGKVDIHPLLRGKKSKSAYRSPGMRYKHYSPHAKVILIEGTRHNVHKKITQLVNQLKKQQKRIGIMTTKRAKYNVDAVEFIGNNDKFAASLFKTFREFDSKKIDIIIVQGISQKGLGLGIMNRLEKAAYKKIKV
ncbi:MAG: L-threonylcarbamoyladenylate synthase [Nitrosopumilaceae archaeon]